MLGRVDSVCDEPLEAGSGSIDHAERRVASARHASRSFGDSLEDTIKGELGIERDARLEEGAQSM
jgi:hypothetical protein